MSKTFAECLMEAGCEPFASAEPFAGLDYARELEYKNTAVELFHKYNLRGFPKFEKLIPAPEPRHYRANSKRKGAFRHGRFVLLNMDSSVPEGDSLLEPESHAKLYRTVGNAFSKPGYHKIASHTNFCIVRGTGRFLALILNVDLFDAQIVRSAKNFAEILKKESPETVSFLLYLDETKSGYYLEQKRPEGRQNEKKLFGPENLSVKLEKIKLMYPPTAFSQVNAPMIPLFAKLAGELLAPEKRDSILDLYCGYGLLGLSMADRAGSLTGVEIDGPAVRAAVNNADFLFKGMKHRFLRGEISPALLRDALPKPEPDRKELVILDPPRSGTAGGVVKEIAKRNPARVLHIICGTDEIPRELAEWRTQGYLPEKILPVDLFPGTAGIETMILLKPKQGKA